MDDVAFITVHTKSSKDKCAAFVTDQEIKYPVAIDGDGETVTAYGITAFPTFVVVGKDGKVFHDDAWPYEKVLEIVEQARKAGDASDRKE